MTEELTFDHLGSNVIETSEDVITRLYVATHSDVIDNPFYSAERFIERVRGYAKAPGFELVMARVGPEPIGLALGYALPRGARWCGMGSPPRSSPSSSLRMAPGLSACAS